MKNSIYPYVKTIINTYLLTLLIAFSFAQNTFGQLPPESPYTIPVDPTDLPYPDYLNPITDPVFNTKITRITDVDIFSDFADYPNVPAGSTLHQYAKIQAWNADMSLIHLGTVFFLNGDDYTLNKTIFSASLVDSRWSNVDPNIMYYGEGEDFKRINVITEEAEVLETFPGYVNATIGPWEGNISADDHYVVVTSYDSKKASIYDIVNDVVLAEKTMNGVGFDWVSFSPSGDYIVMSNNETEHLEIYDLDFNYVRDLKDETQHGDFAVDVNGDEVFVQVIELSMTRLSDGLITDLLPGTDYTFGICGYNFNYNPNIAGHVSGRAFDLPGWALVSASTHACGNGFDGYNWRTEMFLIKLDGSGIIRPFGHAHTASNLSSVASISRDGKRVIYSSNWGTYGNPQTLGDFITEYEGGTDFNLKVNLEGPYQTASNEMNDNLRQINAIPLTEPYTDLGYTQVIGGGESTTTEVLNTVGNDAIVDWIFIELRDPNNPTQVVATQAALLQRDGDIVSTDGATPVRISGFTSDQVFVALKHRNHFGIRSANLYSVNNPITIDFTDVNTPIFGDAPNNQPQPTNTINGHRVLIAGDANDDGQVNPIDKNDFWRNENSTPFDYLNSKADFDLNGNINAIDLNKYWRVNNTKIEILD